MQGQANKHVHWTKQSFYSPAQCLHYWGSIFHSQCLHSSNSCPDLRPHYSGRSPGSAASKCFRVYQLSGWAATQLQVTIMSISCSPHIRSQLVWDQCPLSCMAPFLAPCVSIALFGICQLWIPTDATRAQMCYYLLLMNHTGNSEIFLYLLKCIYSWGNLCFHCLGSDRRFSGVIFLFVFTFSLSSVCSYRSP